MSIGLQTAELNFDIIREIGQEGKNSQVFLAHDKQLDAEIVIKRIKKSKITNSSEYYEESKKLYLSSHNNVVKVSYACSDDNYIYIAMPYYKNGSLKSLITNRNLSIREIIRYSIQFLSGLHHIHSKRLIHFDIKPDNIMISDSNEALLSDFGLAKAMNDFGLANPTSFYRKHIAPEAFQRTEKTLHYDIYLSGITLYRLLNGEKHFENQLSKYNDNIESFKDDVMLGKFPNRKDYLAHIPMKLQKIVNKAIDIDISNRYNNVLELMNDLGDIDENLDWVYSEKEWLCNKGNYTYKIVINDDKPKAISIDTTKINNITGIETKEKKNTFKNLNEKDVFSKIKGVFKSYEK